MIIINWRGGGKQSHVLPTKCSDDAGVRTDEDSNNHTNDSCKLESRTHNNKPTQSTKRKICIHDAFIVKYEADEDAGFEMENPNIFDTDSNIDIDIQVMSERCGDNLNAAATNNNNNTPNPKQRSLPLHRDQSTHSFILALNPLTEYKGGGTYFADLKEAVRTPQGHLLSFAGGQILHAGDPVVSGTRYIIAAFVLLEDESSSSDKQAATEIATVSVNKSSTVHALIDKNKATETSTGFSFSFSL